MKLINSKKAPEAKGPYSHAVMAGNLLFCSGQIALDPKEGTLLENDIEVQTKQVFKNMEAVLKEAGMGLENVVKTTVFLKDINDFQKFNGVYEKCFNGHKPARSTVQAGKLPLDAMVEIECIAHK